MMKPDNKYNAKSERGEQEAVIDWCNVQSGIYPVLKWIYAIPNEERKVQFRVKNRKMGVKAGVPDLCLPYPVGRYHGLYIEMKIKTGRVSPKQRDWMRFLLSVGYFVYTAWSADEAIAVIKSYLND